MQTRDSKTQRGYKVALDAFDVWLDGRTITPENAEDTLQEYVNHMNQTLAPSSTRLYYSRIRKYLKHLKIPIDEIELPSRIEKELYPLKLPDMHRIFQTLRFDDQTLFACQASSGMRIGETVQLKKKDFVMCEDRMIIKIQPRIAKFKKARTTVLTKEMEARIRQILKRIDDDDLVFGTCPNVESAEINKENLLRSALKRVGLDMRYEDTGRYKINTHSFRAFFITQVSRHDPNIAKKMAGEKGYLLQYDRLTDEDYVENAKKFEADLTIFNLAKRDELANKKTMDLQEQINAQQKMIEEQALNMERMNAYIERMKIINDQK